MAAVPKPFVHFISLFCGPIYLVFLASNLSRTTGILLVEALVAVGAGGISLSGFLIVICSRMNQDSGRRFTLSTTMMLIAMLAIYLAYLRQVFNRIDASKFGLAEYAACTVYGLLFIYISTIVMILFIDSAIALTTIVVDVLKPKQQKY